MIGIKPPKVKPFKKPKKNGTFTTTDLTALLDAVIAAEAALDSARTALASATVDYFNAQSDVATARAALESAIVAGQEQS